MGGSLFEFDTTSIFTWIIIGVFFVIGVFSNQKKRNQTANSTSADSRPVYNQDNTPKVVPEEIIRPMAPKESFESSFSLTCPYCGTLITKKRDTCPKCKNII